MLSFSLRGCAAAAAAVDLLPITVAYSAALGRHGLLWSSGGFRREPAPAATASHPQQRQYSSSSASNAVLSNTSSLLRNLQNGAEIFLVGTAHVSKASAEEVRDMIRLVRPQAVMVELCPPRAAHLRTGPAGEQDLLKEVLGQMTAPGGSMGQKVVQAALPMMYRMLKMMGLDPGQEFKVALEEADACGARLVYGDRDAQQTLRRLSETMSVPQMMQMATGVGMPEPPASLLQFFSSQGGGGWGNLESQVEGMKTRALVRDMAAFMRQVNPQLAAALIDERDEIMTRALLRLEGRAVGVVGLAHMDGIERRWEEAMGRQAAVVER